MSIYRLFYFDLKAKAEAIRLVFSAAGVKYEDVRISDEKEWEKLKPTMPFLQMPVLEVTENGHTYRVAQSTTILKFLSNRFNLAGSNEMERTMADMITEEIVDTHAFLYKIYKKPSGEEKQKELKEAMETQVSTNLKCIQNILETNKEGDGFLVGKSLTYADLYLIYFYEWLTIYRDQVLAKFPLLKEHLTKISNLPRIAEHLKNNAHVKTSTLF